MADTSNPLALSTNAPRGDRSYPLSGVMALDTDKTGYFVCLNCKSCFGIPPGELHQQCPCGMSVVRRITRDVYPGQVDQAPPNCAAMAQRLGPDDGPVRFACVHWTAECTENVTALVQCGKLNVYASNPERPYRYLIAVKNHTVGIVDTVMPMPDEPTASERSQVAGEAVDKVVRPVLEWLAKAAASGARVMFSTHYHSRPIGIEHTVDEGEFVRRTNTGDGYFCGQVILSEGVKEPDGSLVFAGFRSCPRCGKEHKTPLPMWKLTNPIRYLNEHTDDQPVEIASHFTYCPTNGQPIVLQVDDLTNERLRSSLTLGGMLQETVGGVAASHAWNEGRLAAQKPGATVDDNPYPKGTGYHDDWTQGFNETWG